MLGLLPSPDVCTTTSTWKPCAGERGVFRVIRILAAKASDAEREEG